MVVSYSESRTETTTWQHHFGIMASLSYSSGLIVDLVANIEFQMTTTYDYLTGGSTAVTNGVQYSESVTVNAEPHMKTTVDLVVMRQDDASIPFWAFVRCKYVDDNTGQIIETETWEPGTWSGVLLYQTNIVVHSEPL